MPPNGKALEKIPKILIGNYQFPHEEEVFHFNEKSISQTEEELWKINIKEESKYYRIDGHKGLVYFPKNEKIDPDTGFSYEIKEDTLYTTVKKDLVFLEINKTLIIKEYKNGFVLNLLDDDQEWSVYFLYLLSDGNLLIKVPRIFNEVDAEDKAEKDAFLNVNSEIKSYVTKDSITSVAELDAILPSEKKYDESGNLKKIKFNPNKKEFEKLVNEGFFGYLSILQRLD